MLNIVVMNLLSNEKRTTMLKIKYMLSVMIILVSTSIIAIGEDDFEKLILGGTYIKEIKIEYDANVDNNEQYYSLERYFRPSNMPILNDRIESSLYNIYGYKPWEIKLDKKFLSTPEETIINYFSVLREAANPTGDINTGCGTLGDARGPYPVAYNFLSDSYKEKYSYEGYLKSFENKLHINLIKLSKVPPDENNINEIKYLVELEVIEGSNKHIGLFAYYYGYIYLDNENGQYKIKNMEYLGENYLCAPYHGWSYDASSLVEIEYGDWCSLISGNIQVEKSGYEKRVYFNDKEENEYYVLFYQLTNGVDIKIADYKKNKNGVWELIYINPEKCLDNKKN